MKKFKWSKLSSILLMLFVILTVILLVFMAFNINNKLIPKFAVFYTLFTLAVGGVILINLLLNIANTKNFSIKKRILRSLILFICLCVLSIVIKYIRHREIFNIELITQNLFLAFLFTFSDLFITSDKDNER